MKFLYKSILKPILFRFSPDRVHDFFTKAGIIAGQFPPFKALVRIFYDYRGPDISKNVDGIRYRTPVLLSAGFDYNARLTGILSAIGMGGEEAGSVTARPCVGNPYPQLTRLPRNKSIQVYKGLKNDGVEAIIQRLKRTRKNNNFVLGISIARTNDKQNNTVEAGIEDYYYSLKRLVETNTGDYYTVNISCPNAFCGETFADSPQLLDKLLSKLSQVKTSKPVYVKMPINLPWKKFNSLLKIVTKHMLNGVVIGNLNKNYNDLDYRDEAGENYRGGLSGKPTFNLSNQLIRQTREKYGNQLTIIGVGGILEPEDALIKFAAGADLVQLITGLIYTGPQLVKDICHLYAKEHQR